MRKRWCRSCWFEEEASVVLERISKVAENVSSNIGDVLLINPFVIQSQAMMQQATQHARHVHVSGLPPTANEQGIVQQAVGA